MRMSAKEKAEQAARATRIAASYVKQPDGSYRDWRGETVEDREKRETAAVAEWAEGIAERNASGVYDDDPTDDDDAEPA
jgi:hypothetical protein